MRTWAPWGLGAWAGLCLCACAPPAAPSAAQSASASAPASPAALASAPALTRSETVRSSVARPRSARLCNDRDGQLEVFAGETPADRALMQVRRGDQNVGLPLESASYQTFVVGTVAETVVTQRYFNPLTQTIEAVYVFPLPHDGAVHDYAIRVQDRTLHGVMKRREEARALYQQAKQAGQSAGLLEQERPNVFTQSVANIPPGELIEVELHVVQPLAREHGRNRLVLPTVVGPRYVPGNALGPTPAGSFAPNTDRVPDGARITPLPSVDASSGCNRVELAVAIEDGAAVRELQSKHHDVEQHDDDGALHVELTAGTAVADRDFELSWSEAGEQPQARLMVQPEPEPQSHDTRYGGYFTLTVEPPRDVAPERALPRELVFVVDTSGSMSGEPIAAAKDAMRKVLRRLGPDDVFQIIEFSQAASSLAPGFLRNTPRDVQRGLELVDGMEGAGGTEMLAGVRAAFALPRDRARLRMVLFLTDGYIGNESEVMTAVRAGIGDARLFSLGVGTAVNRHLLEGLARMGRGAGAFLSPGEDSAEVVDRFFERIDRPALTDVTIDWDGLQVHDVEPRRLPDLFAGQPLVLFGRYAGTPRGELRVHGRRGGRREELPVAVDFARPRASSAALSASWARARIAQLEDQLLEHTREASAENLEAEVTAIALGHHVMTQYTAFVAVDEERRVQPGTQTVHAPLALPAGVSAQGIGLYGTGRGGGGSGYGALGLGAVGTIGHGAGGGAFHGRNAHPAQLRVLDVVVRGGLSKEVVRRIVARHINEVRFCYEQEPPAPHPSLSIQLVIDAHGRITQATVTPSKPDKTKIRGCVAAAFQRWSFPALPTMTTVTLRIEYIGPNLAETRTLKDARQPSKTPAR